MRNFEPIPGESFNGLTARYAAVQRIDRLVDLTSAAGVEHGHRQNAATLTTDNMAALARAMSLNVSELEHRALTPLDKINREFHQVVISVMDIETRKRLFAPGGLAISAHHRASWQLKAFPFCTESWQFLRATCPRASCGVTQRWYHSVGIAYCDRCMQDLRDAPAEIVPSQYRGELKLAAGLIDQDAAQRLESVSSLPIQIRSLGAGGTYELLSCLLQLIDADIGNRGSRRNWSIPAVRLTNAVARAWMLLSGWPDSMHALIDATLASSNEPQHVAARVKVIQFLKSGSRKAVSPPVQIVIEGLFSYFNIASGPSPLRLMDIKAASRCIGLGTAYAAEYRRRNLLSTVHVLRRTSMSPYFDAAELEKIEEDRQDRISLDRAAWDLGISHYGIEQLIALGVIDQLSHRYFVGRYGQPQIRKNSLLTFMATCFDQATSGEPTGWLSLHEGMKALAGRKPWGPALVRISMGKLRVSMASDEGPLARRLLIHPDDADQLSTLSFDQSMFPGATFADEMTGHDAEEALGLKEGGSSKIPRSALVGKAAFSVADVIEMASTYMSVRELAARLRISPAKAFKAANAAGVPHTAVLGFNRQTADAWSSNRQAWA